MAAVPRAAVIGGGLAGLAAAKALLSHGVACTLLDLGGRGVGGRVSSHQLGLGRQGLPLSFDDGAQFFLAASPAFQAEVASWADAGVAAEWHGRHGRITADGAFELHQPGSSSRGGSGSGGGIHGGDGSETRWVGVPTNAAIPQHMARLLLEQHGQQVHDQRGGPLFDLLSGWAVRSMERVGGGCGCGSGGARWRLRGSRVGADASLAPTPASLEQEQEDLGVFDAAILADAAPLLPGSVGAVEGLETASPSLAHLARSVRDVAAAAQPRFVLSVAFAAPLADVPFDFASLEHAGSSSSGTSGGARSCDGCGCGACGPGFGGAFHLVACDSSKPGRPFGASAGSGGVGDSAAAPAAQCWAAVTTAARAEQLLERFGGRHGPLAPDRQAEVAEELLADFRDVMAPFVQGFALPQPAFTHVQRWTRAFVTEPLGAEVLFLPAHKVALCGDVAIGSGVENAWRSGRAAGDAVGRMLRDAAPSSQGPQHALPAGHAR